MGLLLVVLCAVIGVYLHYTDTDRVRAMAQSYLSHILRGRIEIGAAKLSIFEGLRLHDVRVYVDETNDAPDAVLFSADAIIIKYDPRVLVTTGRLEADQLIAIDPHLRLTENTDNGRWNYQRLVREPVLPEQPAAPDRPIVLPEILLRNAQIDYSEIRGGRYIELGSLAVEGQLTPSADGQRYAFELQSRGQSEGVGPVVSGSFSRATGQVYARLARFEFGRDIRTMLFAEARNWWEAHELSGRVNIPVLSYTPARDGKPAAFKVETELDGVTLTVRPEEWLSREELFQRASTRWLYEQMRWMEQAGLPRPHATRRPFDSVSLAHRLASMFDLSPVRLQRVSGTFIFTKDGENDGVEIKEVGGRVENNALVINGRIDGFSPTAAARITIESRASEHIYIPPAPQYVASMPRQVREIYDHLKPQGTCDIRIEFARPANGARPEVSGVVDVVDGNFVFDRFAYPVRQATGKIAFGHDKLLGWDKLQIINLRGKGVAGGANAESVITVNGEIGPLAGDTGVNVKVSAPDVSSEPVLMAAFPEEVREALRIFDPAGTGEWPKFNGSFECSVFRPPGKFQRWTINTDIQLREASGALTVFPYPLEKVSGKLAIRDGYVDIIGASMQRGDATLNVDGRVRWKPERPPGSRPLIGTTRPATPHAPGAPRDKQPSQISPDLKIVARNVPIDEDLLSAMPGDRRKWLERIGVGGVIDVDGRVFRKTPDAQQPTGSARAESLNDQPPAPAPSLASLIDQDFQITLRNGTAWPGEGTFAISDLSGRMRLTSDRVVLSDFQGRRGDATLTGRGTITWLAPMTPQPAGNAHAETPGTDTPRSPRPHVALFAQASNLLLDSALYQALPTTAREAWDQVRPEGTIDIDLSYSGAPDDAPAQPQTSSDAIAAAEALPAPVEALAPATRPASIASGFDLTIKPRKLAVKLKALPYRLDDVAGAVTVAGSKVTLTDLTASHGDARLKLSGTGAVSTRSNWDLTLAATDVPIDDAFREAVPTVIADLFESLKLQGTVSFQFPTLALRGDLSGIGTTTTRPSPASAAGLPLAASRTDPAPPANAAESGAPASAKPQAEQSAPPPDFDVDFAVKMTMPAATMDVGVPLSDVNGAVVLAGTVRQGELSELKGLIESSSLKLAGRPGKNLHAEMLKPAHRDQLRIGPIRGELAGGEIAGDVTLDFPDDAPSRYAMNLALRNADVKQVAAETEQDISGQLTARLALEGTWSDPAARRGRGDVRVEGREMYKIPLVLGLLQITNLSLPITSPFNQAEASYGVDGQKVTFEHISLRSNSMLMQGSGLLDFGAKRVRMTFTTDNPNWPRLPIVGDLLTTAKNELLQIHVTGKLEQPKVSASSINTFQTTIDEVMRGDGRK